MLELLRELPENVVGIFASGKVTADDYDSVFIPAIESALKVRGSVRLLYHLGPAITGFSLGAMWSDMKVGFVRRSAWEKVAIVTDVGWIAGATRVFAITTPCPVKVFSNSQFGEAARWVAAP